MFGFGNNLEGKQLSLSKLTSGKSPSTPELTGRHYSEALSELSVRYLNE